MANIPSIRKGNDLTVRWTITRQGQIEDLAGRKLGVKLLDQFGKAATISWFAELNVITISFEGRNQSALGTYALLLVENEGESGMVTVDTEEAFRLVAHSSQEETGDAGDVDVSYIHLESDVAAPSNGLSAYEIAVKHGFKGTEEEWIDFIESQVITGLDVDFVGEACDFDMEAVLYTPQALTDKQKEIARHNIDAVSDEDIITSEEIDMTAKSIDATVVLEAVRFTPQTLTNAQQAQARQNIGAADAVTEKVILEKMKQIEKMDIAVIGDVDLLTTDAKDTLVNAINEVDAHTDTNTEHIGDLEELSTDAKDNLVEAINEINEKEGDLSGLTTDHKDTLVEAINELHAEHGTLDDLTTTAKDTFVSAINEHDAEIGDLADFALPVKNCHTLVEAINLLANNSFKYIGEYNTIADFWNAHSPSAWVEDFTPSWALITNSTSYPSGEKVPAGTIMWAWQTDNNGHSGHVQWHSLLNWTEIGDISLLTTKKKDYIVNAIEELHLEHGELDNLTTSEKTNFVAAINELDEKQGDEVLTTLADTISGAINEHDTEIGNLATLKTENKDSLVDAINEIADLCYEDEDIDFANDITW